MSKAVAKNEEQEAKPEGNGATSLYPSLAQRALDGAERPPYWRDVREMIVSEAGKEYEKAFLSVQVEMPLVIEADKENAFTKSEYASLQNVLTVIRPILNRHGISMKQFPAAIRGHGDGSKKWFSVPVCTKLTHVETGQFEMIVVDMPVKDDTHSHGAALTYGKRYGPLSYFGIATADTDGMAYFASKLDMEAAEKATDGIIDAINECESETDLTKWLNKNEEGLKLLGEISVGLVRDAYTSKRKELKTADAEK